MRSGTQLSWTRHSSASGSVAQYFSRGSFGTSLAFSCAFLAESSSTVSHALAQPFWGHGGVRGGRQPWRAAAQEDAEDAGAPGGRQRKGRRRRRFRETAAPRMRTHLVVRGAHLLGLVDGVGDLAVQVLLRRRAGRKSGPQRAATGRKAQNRKAPRYPGPPRAPGSLGPARAANGAEDTRGEGPCGSYPPVRPARRGGVCGYCGGQPHAGPRPRAGAALKRPGKPEPQAGHTKAQGSRGRSIGGARSLVKRPAKTGAPTDSGGVRQAAHSPRPSSMRRTKGADGCAEARRRRGSSEKYLVAGAVTYGAYRRRGHHLGSGTDGEGPSLGLHAHGGAADHHGARGGGDHRDFRRKRARVWRNSEIIREGSAREPRGPRREENRASLAHRN